jgi:hypothetical protein
MDSSSVIVSLLSWLVVDLPNSRSNDPNSSGSAGSFLPHHLGICANAENLLEKRLIGFVNANTLGADVWIDGLNKGHDCWFSWLLLLTGATAFR